MDELERAVVLALAASRLARLVSVDRITEPLRDDVTALMASDVPEVAAGAAWVHELLGCPWCVAVWAAAAVMVLGVSGPRGRTLVRLLAVAQLAGRVGVQSRPVAVV